MPLLINEQWHTSLCLTKNPSPLCVYGLVTVNTSHGVAALESFDRPALSAIISYRLPVCFRPTHPAFLQALSSSCAAATSWLPSTCKFPSTLLILVEVVLFLLADLSLALFQYRFHCAASVLSYGGPNSSAQLSIVTPSRHWWFFRYAPLMVFAEGEGFEPPCHF